MNNTLEVSAIRLDKIGISGGTQPREEINEDVRPIIVDTKEFFDALWSNKIKS